MTKLKPSCTEIRAGIANIKVAGHDNIVIKYSTNEETNKLYTVTSLGAKLILSHLE